VRRRAHPAALLVRIDGQHRDLPEETFPVQGGGHEGSDPALSLGDPDGFLIFGPVLTEPVRTDERGHVTDARTP